MLFNSPAFLYLFLPITYFVFWRLKTKTGRYRWMTLTGYVFYSVWSPKFCLLMALSTVVSYLAGLGFLRWSGPRQRKLCLILPVAFDLALLAVFKYADFGLSTFNAWLAPWLGLPETPLLHIVLPVGISFYTFHTITYIVDSYRGAIRPTRDFFEFACYVSFFAQLVAGPIVRFRQIEQDLEQIDKPNRAELLEEGWSFFLIGLAKKVLIADSIAAIIDPALENHSALSSLAVWMCALGYAYQLYFDFSGYSDMAVGLGRMFGLRLPQNFDSPYKALDIADFWRRWHISLSTILRDYLYIPLGGSRQSNAKTYRNLMLTMLLGGLWHGASWTFVLWGGYHGLLLSLNRAFARPIDRLPQALRRTLTFLLVVGGWVLFRATSFEMAGSLLTRMIVWQPGSWMTGAAGLTILLFLAAAFAHFGPNTWELRHRWSPAAVAAMGVLLVACLIAMQGGNQSPFLYFQF